MHLLIKYGFGDPILKPAFFQNRIQGGYKLILVILKRGTAFQNIIDMSFGKMVVPVLGASLFHVQSEFCITDPISLDNFKYNFSLVQNILHLILDYRRKYLYIPNENGEQDIACPCFSSYRAFSPVCLPASAGEKNLLYYSKANLLILTDILIETSFFCLIFI